MALTWEEKLEQRIKEKNNKKASALVNKYKTRFPLTYINEFSPEFATNDIAYLEQLSPTNQLEIAFYTAKNDLENPFHLRLYLWDKPIPLSNLCPIFENLNLYIYNEQTYKLKPHKNQTLWICDFAISYKNGDLKVEEISFLFQEAFTLIYFGLAEDDGFNKLILGSKLDWREVMLIRTYASYLRQINFRYSQSYIVKALVKNSFIAKDLVDLFLEMHRPPLKKNNRAQELENQILSQLEAIESLDEDRIIRHMLNLIKASLRTNFFQLFMKKNPKYYLAIKLNSRAILDIPLPAPLYEIYIYSPQFEGIHLRSDKVARGGIRWSERPEDFRTEILGLMKAQNIKNSIIVPGGAKGGFVLKKPPESREMLQAEIVRCYKFFISGLLDLTDNIKNGRFIHPKHVVCYDGYDPYLVVAADKGTAAFSDIANDISFQYHFWLGDAFASGGSHGYDHKKMGITARGVWESIKRHFMDLNIDLSKTYITVIGIGDMSGDVFGNAMLYSERIKLVAAFDHRHIFIDPDPNPETSYKERLRLFKLPHSSWEDYQPKLISSGGGVFRRTDKSIKLSKEIKDLLKIKNANLTPDDLIRAILKAPVKLLFNGGIGTYVKASTESNMDVGDRANDWCRINANELRTEVVAEGGNLGFTQPARIEYALNGGMINTDSIDNSAGVDCSDHEVNLKILLDSQVASGKLTEKSRNELLALTTNEVADLVLNDNYEQAVLLSYSAFRSSPNLGLHVEYMHYLELKGVIDRKVDFLPDEKKLLERKAAGLGLTRPEFAVLIAFTKLSVKNEILNSNLSEDPFLMNYVVTAFPPSIRAKYRSAMDCHPLRRDIVATELSNIIINGMGMTYIFRLQKEVGATVEEIVRAYMLASQIYKTDELQRLILSLNYQAPSVVQYDMLYNIRYLISIATRWFLHKEYIEKDLNDVINQFLPHIKTLEKITPVLMGGVIKQYLESLTKQFLSWGLPAEKAYLIATYRTMYSALNIIHLKLQNNFEIVKTTKVYYAVGERFNLLWFRDQIGSDNRDGHWNILSRLTIRDELDVAQCAITLAILKMNVNGDDVSQSIEKWIEANPRIFARWENLLEQLHSSNNIEYPMFFIAIRELINLTLGRAK